MAGLTLGFVMVVLVGLAVMREVVILRADVESLAKLVRDPEGVKFSASTLSESLRGQIAVSPDGRHALVFVSPGCPPCEAYTADIASAHQQGRLRREDVSFVVVGGQPGRWRDGLEKAGSVIVDTDGRWVD